MFHDRAIAARKQTIIFNDGPNTKLAIKMRDQMPQPKVKQNNLGAYSR